MTPPARFRRPSRQMPLPWQVSAGLLALLVPLSVARAASCEEIRASIEARIRDNGVQSPSVRVVDAAASTPGRVVGTCDLGARKIVYLRPDGPQAVATAPAQGARPAARREVIITECRDGREITSGTCPK